MTLLDLTLMILSFVCFLLATVKIETRIDLKALGLALWVLSLIIRLRS